MYNSNVTNLYYVMHDETMGETSRTSTSQIFTHVQKKTAHRVIPKSRADVYAELFIGFPV